MDYYGLLVSGKGVSQTIGSGDRAFDTVVKTRASLYVSSGGYIESTTAYNNTWIYNAGSAASTVLSAGTMVVSRNAVADDTRVLREGKLVVAVGGVATSVNLATSGIITVTAVGGDSVTRVEGVNPLGSFGLSNGVASNFLIESTGQLLVSSGGTALDTTVNFAGYLTVMSGGTALGATVRRGGHVGFTFSAGDRTTLISGVNDLGEFRFSSGVGSNFIIADGFDTKEIHSGGTMCHTLISGLQAFMYIYNGALATATSVGRNGCLQINDGGIALDAVISSGGSMNVCDGARVSGVYLNGVMTVQSGLAGADESGGRGTLAEVVVGSGGVLNFTKSATLSGGMVVGGTMNVNAGIAVAGDDAEVRVVSGGVLNVASRARITDAVLEAGAALTLAAGAYTGDRLTLDFSGGGGDRTIAVNDLSRVGASTAVYVRGLGADGTYTLGAGATGNEAFTLLSGNGNDYAMNGTLTSVVDAFTGSVYSTSVADGELRITVAPGTHTIAATAAATALETGGAELNGGDREARWTSETAVASSVLLTSGMTKGNAWLELDGYAGGDATTLFGTAADQAFGGAVNLKLGSGSLRNLAAGAAAGGSVKAVNLAFDGATLNGVGYAGGFGTVAGATETRVAAGVFAKDFYAGALANKNAAPTSVGDVVMTVAGGAFSGNLYGASAVKTDAAVANGLRHTAGDVTLTVTGGETTKGGDACIFAGGYATGTASGTVYTVASVTAGIAGGSWGGAKNGRGVFGGVMASGVEARTGNVNLTVSGGNTGNVYGGGWAQKNGRSVVGDVNIFITGGKLHNVYGGGCHSTTGGTTEAGKLTVTVAGGTITGAIHARGQFADDTVEGAEVVFTGANDYGCDVSGYGTAGGGATLEFVSYTGAFSGSIGGFDDILIGGDSAMTLGTAADDVSNGRWEFDLTGRDGALAGTSLLAWSAADFANDTVVVRFADDAQARGAWHIAAVAEAFANTTFEVEVGDASQGVVAYGTPIADGEYQDWGFVLDGGVLKFKNLA